MSADIGIVMAFRTLEAARAFVLMVQASQPPDMREALTAYKVQVSTDTGVATLTAYMEDINWHIGFNWTKAHYKLLSLAEESHYACTRIAVVGDDLDDNALDDTEPDQPHESPYDHTLYTDQTTACYDAVQLERRVVTSIEPADPDALSLV